MSDIRFPNLWECINHISVIGCTDTLVEVSGISIYSTGFHLSLLILFKFLLFFPASWDIKGNQGFSVHLFYLVVPYPNSFRKRDRFVRNPLLFGFLGGVLLFHLFLDGGEWCGRYVGNRILWWELVLSPHSWWRTHPTVIHHEEVENPRSSDNLQ